MVVLHAKELKKNLEKIIGLIGKKPMNVWFKTRFGIHTFGMTYPIDILILDKKNTVVRIKRSLKPNRLFFWNPIYNKVVECIQGTIDKKQMAIGETIDLREAH